MNEEMKQKLLKLCQDKEYLKKLLSLEDIEKISKELRDNGIDLSKEEIKKIIAILKKQEKCELSDELLEKVSGGYIVVY